MGTRSYADVAPTASTMALNAYIFGYAGHSMVTPHEALKQLWWTDQRIDAKVTRVFINSKLRSDERKFLTRQLAFGEGLTDGTYMDWILQRARRLFLILAETGVPDQIFGCIDDSWDDDDLPISLEDVASLDLSLENDEVLNRKFYDLQFVYLLRELKQGEHIDYGPNEHIPMDHVSTLPPAVSLQIWDRIHFPKRQKDTFSRRKYLFSNKPTSRSNYENFKRDICEAQALEHEHIASVWASYTSEDAGYVVCDFVGEHTLGTFFAHRTAPQYMRVASANRPHLLCEWMHCLSDALAFLHHRGLAHTAIMPSNIIIDDHNRIAFADIGSLHTFQRGKKPPHSEPYDYAAPEQQISKTPYSLSLSPPTSSKGAFGKLHRMRSSRSSMSTYSLSSGSARSNSVSTTTSILAATPPPKDANTFPTVAEESTYPETSILHPSPNPVRSPTISLLASTLGPNNSASSTTSESATRRNPRSERGPLWSSVRGNSYLIDLPKATPQQSDVFSFACIMLDLITFLVKGKLTEVVKQRSSNVKSLRNKNTTHLDGSFHENSDRIHSWVEHLIDECGKSPGRVHRGIPAILDLVRQMMAQNAFLRPNALEVRLRLTKVLTSGCGISSLCCTGRNWSDPSSMAKLNFDGPDLPLAHDVKLDAPVNSTSQNPLPPFLRSISSDTRASEFVNYFRRSQTRGGIHFDGNKPLIDTKTQSQDSTAGLQGRSGVFPSSPPSTNWPPRLESRLSMLPATFSNIPYSSGPSSSIIGTSGNVSIENRKASDLSAWKRAFARVHS